MQNITPQPNMPAGINPAIISLIKQPYQKHNPAKGEELDEFINSTDDDDEDEDYEQTESTINRPDSKNPNRKFPDDDSNTGDNPIYPDSNEVVANNGDDDDDEIVTSVGY